MPSVRRLAVGIAAAALALPAGGVAADWTPPRDVFPPAVPGLREPKVAFAGDGSALAVWARPYFNSGVMQSATLDPGSTAWRPVQTVPGYDDWRVSDTDLALDARGNAVATWVYGTMSGSFLYGSTRRANGAWTQAQTLSMPVWVGSYGLGMDPDGKAIVAFPQNDWGFVDGAAVARVRLPGGAWDAPTPMVVRADPGDQPSVQAADVAIEPSGRAVAVWSQSFDGASQVYASWRPVGGPWSAPTLVSGVGTIGRVQVGIDGNGTATVAWLAGDDIYVAQAGWGSTTWPARTPISTVAGGGGSGSNDMFALTVDRGGKPIVVWVEYGRTNAAVKPVGGTWSAPKTLSGDGAASPTVTLDERGDAVAAWTRYSAGGAIAEASIRPQGGDWTPAHQLNTPPSGGSEPGVAFSPDGDAVVVWNRTENGNSSIAFTVHDVTPPSPGATTIPATAIANRAVAMSMTAPSDRWSAIGSVTWDFGDGATGSGLAVTHAYGAPGSYPVTVGVVDAAGNAATVRRQVTVTAPPSPQTPTGQGGSQGTPGITGTTSGVTVGIRGAAAAKTPAKTSGRVARTRLKVAVTVPRKLRARERTVIRVALNRRVRGALMRVQLRRGVSYATIAQGRVSGRRIPVALGFNRRGTFLVRVQVIESGRRAAVRVLRLVVRR
ncbi:MAG TPA: PKD domain-containing protein [Miltoncostaeaceae bacterium]|jgi:hypothetical protein|nr:PKD domain-containing protein [Miltoncostaeaceae bacterium]